jgi:hypothetical protein
VHDIMQVDYILPKFWCLSGDNYLSCNNNILWLNLEFFLKLCWEHVKKNVGVDGVIWLTGLYDRPN